MNTINEVKMLAAKKGLTLTYIAKYLSKQLGKEITLDNLSKKLRYDTIRYSDMKIIAQALNSELIFKENEKGCS